MCGIIGYVGRARKPLLLSGLERLEYRGYDSAGIALLEDDGLDYVRAVGNLAEPEGRGRRRTARRRRPASVTRAGRRTARHRAERAPADRCETASSRSSSTASSRTTASCASSCSSAGHTFTLRDRRRGRRAPLERQYDGDLVAAVRAAYPRARGPLHDRRDPPRPAGPARRRAPPDAARRRHRRGRDLPRVGVAAFLAETRRVQFIDDGEVVEITPDGARFFADGDEVEHEETSRLGRGGRREAAATRRSCSRRSTSSRRRRARRSATASATASSCSTSA